MSIERITPEEFQTVRPGDQRGSTPNPETVAFTSLQPGEAYKSPCRWKHSSTHSCNGAAVIHSAARRHKMKAATRCYEGYLYVIRVA